MILIQGFKAFHLELHFKLFLELFSRFKSYQFYSKSSNLVPISDHNALIRFRFSNWASYCFI